MSIYFDKYNEEVYKYAVQPGERNFLCCMFLAYSTDHLYQSLPVLFDDQSKPDMMEDGSAEDRLNYLQLKVIRIYWGRWVVTGSTTSLGLFFRAMSIWDVHFRPREIVDPRNLKVSMVDTVLMRLMSEGMIAVLLLKSTIIFLSGFHLVLATQVLNPILMHICPCPGSVGWLCCPPHTSGVSLRVPLRYSYWCSCRRRVALGRGNTPWGHQCWWSG